VKTFPTRMMRYAFPPCLFVGGVTLFAGYKLLDCGRRRLIDDIEKQLDKIEKASTGRRNAGIVNARFGSLKKGKEGIDNPAFVGSLGSNEGIAYAGFDEKEIYCVEIRPLRTQDGKSTLVKLESDESDYEVVGLAIIIFERNAEAPSTNNDNDKPLRSSSFEGIETSVAKIVQFITDTTQKICKDNQNKEIADETTQEHMIKKFEKIFTIPVENGNPEQFKVQNDHKSLIYQIRSSLPPSKKIDFEQCLKAIKSGQRCEEALEEFAKKKFKKDYNIFLREYGRKYAWQLLRIIYDSDDSKPITAECRKNLFEACGFSIKIDTDNEHLELKEKFEKKKKMLENSIEEMNNLKANLKKFFEEFINSENASKFNTMFFILYCFKANGLACYVQLVNLFFVQFDDSNDPYTQNKNQLLTKYADFIFSTLTLDDLQELVKLANIMLNKPQNSSS